MNQTSAGKDKTVWHLHGLPRELTKCNLDGSPDKEQLKNYNSATRKIEIPKWMEERDAAKR